MTRIRKKIGFKKLFIFIFIFLLAALGECVGVFAVHNEYWWAFIPFLFVILPLCLIIKFANIFNE